MQLSSSYSKTLETLASDISILFSSSYYIFIGTLLQQACAVITGCLPVLLERVTSGEHLAQLRDLIHKSISLSTRDALLGDWNAIVNRVFDGENDLQNILFETLKTVFHARLEGIIDGGMTEIEQTVETGLNEAISEFNQNGIFNFNISTFIWSQNEENKKVEATEAANVDWARKNISLRAKSFHPIVVSVVQVAAERFDLMVKDVKKFTTDRYVLRSHSKRFVEFFSEFSNRYCKEVWGNRNCQFTSQLNVFNLTSKFPVSTSNFQVFIQMDKDNYLYPDFHFLQPNFQLLHPYSQSVDRIFQFLQLNFHFLHPYFQLLQPIFQFIQPNFQFLHPSFQFYIRISSSQNFCIQFSSIFAHFSKEIS